VKGRLCAEKSEGRGDPAAKQFPPQPGTIPALGLRAGTGAVAIIEQTTLVKEIAHVVPSSVRHPIRPFFTHTVAEEVSYAELSPVLLFLSPALGSSGSPHPVVGTREHHSRVSRCHQFGFPLIESLYDGAGNLVSVTLFGINVTFLFESL
jgi:hypothetical protein